MSPRSLPFRTRPANVSHMSAGGVIFDKYLRMSCGACDAPGLPPLRITPSSTGHPIMTNEGLSIALFKITPRSPHFQQIRYPHVIFTHDVHT
jgi:hypothetical protein